MGYSPQGLKDLDTTEKAHKHTLILMSHFSAAHLGAVREAAFTLSSSHLVIPQVLRKSPHSADIRERGVLEDFVRYAHK